MRYRASCIFQTVCAPQSKTLLTCHWYIEHADRRAESPSHNLTNRYIIFHCHFSQKVYETISQSFSLAAVINLMLSREKNSRRCKFGYRILHFFPQFLKYNCIYQRPMPLLYLKDEAQICSRKLFQSEVGETRHKIPFFHPSIPYVWSTWNLGHYVVFLDEIVQI